MPQSINYSNDSQYDFNELFKMIQTQCRFGMIHESILSSIEESMYNIFDGDCLYDIFDNADDQSYFVKVFRNAIFCHTNHYDLDDEEINQMIIDYSK